MGSVDEKLFWGQIITLISEKKLIPVIGKELLKVNYQNQEILLYKLLAQKLSEYFELKIEELPDGDEINTVVYECGEKGIKNYNIYSALKEVMPKDDEVSLPEPLIKLASINNFKLFVTTTFDPLLERAIDKVRHNGGSGTKIISYTPNDIQDIESEINRLIQPVVYHLFGRLSATPDYVVTQEDTLEYMHALQSAERQPRLLFDELNKNNLLILGCSFNDWLARFFIRTPKREPLSLSRGSINFIVDNQMAKDINLMLFLKNFSGRTKIYRDGNVAKFIDEMHQRWMEQSPQQDSTLVSDALSYSSNWQLKRGMVFLSYASEDKASAENIRDALKNTGIDVFFDKDFLHAGDDFEAKIKFHITECALFVPVISKNVKTELRRFFRLEWNVAIQESLKSAVSNNFIMPVVIDDTSYDDPQIPEKFLTLHWENAPGGNVSTDFVEHVKQSYRNYQKM
jgi:signal recognition particle subunit SEC65